MYKSLRLITFDVTNTLITVAKDIGYEYAKVATIYGVKGADNPDRIRQLSEKFPSNFKKYNQELPNFGHQSGINPVEWWSRVVVSTFQDSGFNDEADRRRIQNTAAHLFKLYSRGSQWSLKESTHDLLFELRKQKPEISLAVLSNFDDRLHSILRDLGLTHFFKYIFLSKEIGAAKPNPELFQYVFVKAGIKSPGEEYLHIGDNVELDYRPAKAIGGNAILVKRSPTSKTPQDIESGHVVGSLKDLYPILGLKEHE